MTSVLEEAYKVAIGKFKLKAGDEEGEPAEGPGNPLAIFQASVFGVATNPSEPKDRVAMKKPRSESCTIMLWRRKWAPLSAH